MDGSGELDMNLNHTFTYGLYLQILLYPPTHVDLCKVTPSPVFYWNVLQCSVGICYGVLLEYAPVLYWNMIWCFIGIYSGVLLEYAPVFYWNMFRCSIDICSVIYRNMF